MAISWLPHLFFFSLLLIINLALLHARCPEDQRTLLLELKSQLIFNSSDSHKLVGWNQTIACCRWAGVECDGSGHVVSLQLNAEAISGGFHESSSLFGLRHLKKLSLANNQFIDTQIPWGLHRLIYLTDLDFSGAGFMGPIPPTLGNLTELVYLDLSFNFLTGSLSYLHFERLSNLVDLVLESNSLSGSIPFSIFFLPSLRSLDLSNNQLNGEINESPIINISNIVHLDLSENSFSGRISFFLCGLPSLQSLQLSNNQFSGQINDSAVVNISNLVDLDLSNNSFRGRIPHSFFHLPSLVTLWLSKNQFSEFPTVTVNTSNIRGLYLKYNSFSSSIPSWLFRFPLLRSLDLSNNQLSGQVDESPIANLSSWIDLDLSNNRLEGPIPDSFFQLLSLRTLLLSGNLFSGTFQLEKIQSLPNLVELDLSNNNLIVDSIKMGSSLYANSSLLTQLSRLSLASCNLYSVPNFIKQSPLKYLDLSKNRIVGEIPSWIWEIGNGTLYQLNLSDNLLVDLQKPYHIPTSIGILDLHSNMLQGELPLTPSIYVDFSDNNFDNSIPFDFGNTPRRYVSLANNSLTGEIPISLCNSKHLLVLDLSFNDLSSAIPYCLFQNLSELGVLNLKSNNIYGDIPDTFPVNCGLQTVDLSNNKLGGRIPKSLGFCKELKVMSVGSNHIDDSFPCMLSSSLRVLVLRSNRFHGEIKCYQSWPNLQIIDIASNNFSGTMHPINFSSWRGMMVQTDAQLKQKQAGYIHHDYLFNYYVDEVALIIKGIELKLVKIRVDFTTIDFSCNNFHGEIPDVIGNLKFLYLLNLSHNSLIGTIPKSFGNLTQLGSLDLSMNKLRGTIPEELARHTFLSVLNLSYNKLVGLIPSGSQFQTFAADSFQGNPGLCGFPLNISCKPSDDNDDSSPPQGENGREIKWEYVSAALGYVVGLGSILWLLLFCRSFRDKYFEKVDEVVEQMFDGRSNRRRQARRRVVRNQGTRQ